MLAACRGSPALVGPPSTQVAGATRHSLLALATILGLGSPIASASSEGVSPGLSGQPALLPAWVDSLVPACLWETDIATS